jgi:hypothetical protein
MSQGPRFWKTLERHPESAEYRDLSGRALSLMTEGIKEHGVLGNRKVTVHEGKILDGWQMYQACIAADVKPDFQQLPADITPARYVEIMNEARRHDDAEELARLAAKRQERVVARRQAGDSIRTIAEAEGVDPKTIQRDIEKSTVAGATVDPPGGKITGKDGRKRPATRSGDADETPLLCTHCKRRKRVGQEPLAKCAVCSALRKAQADRRGHRPKSTNGRLAFDPRPFKAQLAAATRQTDAAARHYSLSNGTLHEDVLAKLDAASQAFQALIAAGKAARQSPATKE